MSGFVCVLGLKVMMLFGFAAMLNTPVPRPAQERELIVYCVLASFRCPSRLIWSQRLSQMVSACCSIDRLLGLFAMAFRSSLVLAIAHRMVP